MTFVLNVSIRTKFLLAILLTVITALLVALAAIATLSHSISSDEFRHQLNVLVNITAERSEAALAFGDKRAVTQNLQALSTMSAIDSACMYDASGAVFAQYQRFDGRACPDKVNITNALGHDQEGFRVATDLAVKGRVIGTLYIAANSDSVMQRLMQFLLYAGVIVLFSCLVAYLLAYRLQFALTSPIIKLSNLAKEIGNTRDFSLRARVFNDDEAGYLARSFNGLIDDVQESHIQMEELVSELQEKKRLLESHTELVEGRNKTIKNMFTGASHDLKQPLQAMSLFVNALNESSDESQKVLLKKLDLAIQNMRALFEDLLDVSKLEARLDNLETGPVELKPMLDSVFHEFEAMAVNKSLSFRFHSRDYIVDSDIGMLERIIRNLLSNAIRYTETGGVLLACRKRNGQACIEIWDTGRGIPDADMESIFKRFYQVDKKSEQEQQGYGLGLSIVKRLAEMLHHPIEVQSTFGRGTMFRVLVPITERSRIETPPREARQLASPLTNTPTAINPEQSGEGVLISMPSTNAKVLLIDDDDLVRESIELLMSSWGISVTSFDTIESMSTYLNDSANVGFDLLVSDFQLSETENGLDAIAAARGAIGQDLPALIVTGTDNPDLIATIKASGIRHLKKPVKPAKLRALINHLIGAQSPSD